MLTNNNQKPGVKAGQIRGGQQLEKDLIEQFKNTLSGVTKHNETEDYIEFYDTQYAFVSMLIWKEDNSFTLRLRYDNESSGYDYYFKNQDEAVRVYNIAYDITTTLSNKVKEIFTF